MREDDARLEARDDDETLSPSSESTTGAEAEERTSIADCGRDMGWSRAAMTVVDHRANFRRPFHHNARFQPMPVNSARPRPIAEPK